MLTEQALNATEVAGLLHIGRNAVYALAKSGELPSYRLGRKLLFTLSDVEAYARAQRVGAVPAAGAAASASSAALAAASSSGATAPGGLLASGAGALEGGAATGASALAMAAGREGAARASAREAFVIAGHGMAADLFVERLEQMGVAATRCPLESYAALVALYEGRADAAVVHLYDQRTNSYNVPYVQRLAPGMPAAVIRLVRRQQGFAVTLGNPLKLSSWGAVVRDGVRLANRALGSGSRVLLDEKLLAMEVRPESVAGYRSAYASGLAAAGAVAAGLADVAVLGEQEARGAHDVEFVPLQSEWVDIVVAKRGGERRLDRLIRRICSDEAFQNEYRRIVIGDATALGSIVYEC